MTALNLYKPLFDILSDYIKPQLKHIWRWYVGLQCNLLRKKILTQDILVELMMLWLSQGACMGEWPKEPITPKRTMSWIKQRNQTLWCRMRFCGPVPPRHILEAKMQCHFVWHKCNTSKTQWNMVLALVGLFSSSGTGHLVKTEGRMCYLNNLNNL